MTIDADLEKTWLEQVGAMALELLGWQGLLAELVLIGTIFVYRLLAERSRRKTVLSVLRDAPGGSVVILGEKGETSSLEVRVGEVARPPAEH